MSDRHFGNKDGFSRRAFLKGSSAVAAATALQAQTAAAADNDGDQVVSGKQKIQLNVNGQNHSAEVEPRTTLLDVLRYQLELTGAKPVSADGSSGASTVLIDGKPATASTTLAIACTGKKIQTVEGIGADDPVIQAFIKHDAEQCGFCTPGFVVAVRAFLNKNPQASEQQIRDGLNSNICRCGTYANIIEAANAVVKGGV
ncbi:MAG: (2Fe-2S)-binding protein [Planctomycetales bacterium]|nr:(2Fe-2S)-binding protein [Planctomycetales bacterium]MCA9227604.1 (2Fe-2S)-binding protein [Planctomycetales bacterium]